MAPVEGTPPTAGLPAGLHPGSRAAVPRRSEGTRLSSPSDDEVGGFQSAIRRDQDCAPLSTSERADTPFICERARKAAASRRNPQRAERAIKRGASNQTPDRAPPCRGEARGHAFRPRATTK
jgi:hypothetical protein